MNFLLLFSNFEWEHFGKDVFLTPYTLAQKYGASLTIVYKQSKTNKDLPKEYKGVSLRSITADSCIGRLNPAYWLIKSLLFIFFSRGEYDVLICFHLFFRTIVQTRLFKTLNPQSQIYVKLDIPDFIIKKIKQREKNFFWNRWYHKCVECVNYFSIETSEACKQMQNLSVYKKNPHKFIFMPNGFDDLYAKELDVFPYSFNEKENMVITVGRIGTNQKNNQLFLNALKKLTTINDWKFYFIGPVENEFKKVIDEFYTTFPQTKDYVFFTGAIHDKYRLWSYYAKAKVFVLTSTWESYGLVLNEARYFKDYIISTDVGAAKDIIEKKYGELIDDSPSSLCKVLQAVISGSKDIDVYSNNEQDDSITWQSLIHRIPLKA